MAQYQKCLAQQKNNTQVKEAVEECKKVGQIFKKISNTLEFTLLAKARKTNKKSYLNLISPPHSPTYTTQAMNPADIAIGN
jgi:hypothetical protein